MAESRKRSKVSSSKPTDRAETVTIKATVARETARKLRLESFGRDISLGQVLDELVRSTPQRFILQDRAKGSGVPEGQPTPPVPSVSSAVGPKLASGLQESA